MAYSLQGGHGSRWPLPESPCYCVLLRSCGKALGVQWSWPPLGSDLAFRLEYVYSRQGPVLLAEPALAEGKVAIELHQPRRVFSHARCMRLVLSIQGFLCFVSQCCLAVASLHIAQRQ